METKKIHNYVTNINNDKIKNQYNEQILEYKP
jgi:hypothetical protein